MKVNHFEAIGYPEERLKEIFNATETGPAATMINTGVRRYDPQRRVIFNDTAWKGYFPAGSALNLISSNINSSFKKRFFLEGDAIKGVTSDTDYFINASNTIEEVVLTEEHSGLPPGKYILLRYTDLQWRLFYDIFKVVSDNLLIGKVFVGVFPRGKEVFTFPMVRQYTFDEMTLADHRDLYDNYAVAPDVKTMQGVWDMAAVANSNHRKDVAQLEFDVKPDNAIKGRYLFMKTVHGQMKVEIDPDHLSLIDFTPFHDEIRAIDENYMLGRWTTSARLPFGPFSIGLLQEEPTVDGPARLGFHYIIQRSQAKELRPNWLLGKLMDKQIGVSMHFDEQMDGWCFPGDKNADPDHIKGLDPAAGHAVKFNVRITIPSIDTFVSGAEHAATLAGTITFAQLRGDKDVTLNVEGGSTFNYLMVNPETKYREMRYFIRFNHKGTPFVLRGVKYMHKKEGKAPVVEKLLEDYTTLFIRVEEETSGELEAVGLMKFRTFESFGSVAGMFKFVTSFTVPQAGAAATAAAIAKFDAFTTQFIFDEYDPLGL